MSIIFSCFYFRKSGERPLGPKQSSDKGRKNDYVDRGMRTSLLVLGLKEDKFWDSGKEVEGKAFDR